MLVPVHTHTQTVTKSIWGGWRWTAGKTGRLEVTLSGGTRGQTLPQGWWGRELREGWEEIVKLKTHARSSVLLHLAHNGGINQEWTTLLRFFSPHFPSDSCLYFCIFCLTACCNLWPSRLCRKEKHNMSSVISRRNLRHFTFNCRHSRLIWSCFLSEEYCQTQIHSFFGHVRLTFCSLECLFCKLPCSDN